MKEKRIIPTFEGYVKNCEIESLLESTDYLLESIKQQQNSPSYNDMTDEQLEEACEKEYQSFIENISFLTGDASIEEGNAEKVAVGAAAASSALLGTAGGFTTVTTGIGLAATTSVTTFSIGAAIAASMSFVPMMAAAAGVGLLLYKVIKKKKEIKKGMQGEEPGTPHYEALKKRLKNLTLSEIQEYNKLKEAKALARGAQAAAKGGEGTLPEDPKEKAAYEKGLQMGKQAREEAKDIKKLPEEEKKARLKELDAELKAGKAKKEKLKSIADKIKELKEERK
jgi:hypothetical protein